MVLCKVSFNSMKVRLKHFNKQLIVTPGRFQFHEGPIKTAVREFAVVVVNEFQFHEGPIKTIPSLPFSNVVIRFQFHEGPIKT